MPKYLRQVCVDLVAREHAHYFDHISHSDSTFDGRL